MNRALFISGAVAAFALAGCTANLETTCTSGPCGPPPPVDAGCRPPKTGDYPMDVGMTIAARCQICHMNPPLEGVPIPLTRYEDVILPYPPGATMGTTPTYEAMAKNISSGFMPFGWMNAQPIMIGGTQVTSNPLTPDEKNLLLAWLSPCPIPVAEGTGADKE